MINELLRDLINTERVGSCIDNIMVEMEMEKEHDKLVAKILKILEKNDLYVKLEKCKWKVKEVDSLEIVLGLEGIKMEEAKVKVVLDWPVSKLVKNIQKFL